MVAKNWVIFWVPERLVIFHAEWEKQRGYWRWVKEEFAWGMDKRAYPGQGSTPGR